MPLTSASKESGLFASKRVSAGEEGAERGGEKARASPDREEGLVEWGRCVLTG